MHKKTTLISIFLLTLLLSLPVAAAKKENKAGGVRDDHASEMGMEKGKAWAGSKEKKSKDEEEDVEKEKSEKKAKKEKKTKKDK